MKTMYVDSLACVRVKGGEPECFRIDSGVRQGCIVSPWLFNVYTDAVTTELKIEGKEWRLPGLLYAHDFVLCGELGESGDYLASCMQMIWFCMMSQRRT